ncbi:MAG: diguanylate cyclase, partial [Pseudomonadota bacterium]
MNILLLEDDELDARLVGEALSEKRCAEPSSVVHVRSLAVALARLGRDDFDAVVVDLNLPDAHGSDAVDQLLQLKPHIPIVILSGNDDEKFALDLIRKGAQDFLVKGKDGLGSLGRTLKFCVERKATEQRLQHLASYDALTGLANRQEVYTQLRKACAHAERQGDMVALLLIDLDRFKHANDIHGHQVGDTILKTIGSRLQALTREGDTAGRLGGDEFAVVLEGLAYAHSAHRWAERALKTINEPIEVDELVFPLKASIGGAIFPSHGDDVDAIMRCADQAMYSVKSTGRNSVAFFQPNMAHRDSRRNDLSIELGNALELGAVTAAFQPKVSLKTGAVIGFEALARWIRATDDIVAPAEFLPLAQQQRLMPALGRRMRFLALEAAARWRTETGKCVPVSVNVDAQELQSASFAADLASDLAKNSVEPATLRLEVSE